MDNTSQSLQTKVKSWWDKPDGIVGQVIIGILVALIALGILINLNPIIAWLALLAQNTLKLALFSGAIGALFLFFTNKRVRATIFYLFQTVVRSFTGLVIELDPIAILKTYLDTMLKNIQKTGEQIGKLRGSISTLTAKKDQASESMQNSAALLKQARIKNIQGQIVLHANQVGRLEKVIKTYDNLLLKLNGLLAVLQKIYENTQIVYEDTKNDIEIKESEWESIKMASSAMKSAMSAISGDPDQRAIYEQALSYMQDDLGMKVGEMQQFLVDTNKLMDTIDLQSDANVDRGLAIVNQLEKNADSLLTKISKPEEIEHKPMMEINFTPSTTETVKVERKTVKQSFDEIYKN